MEARTQRIIDTAVALAEKGGFEAVRLRDVASHAGVALGTIYKRFPSKEDILVAALDREVQAFARLVTTTTLSGNTAAERAGTFFLLATQTFLERPRFARAVLRAAACGEPEIHAKVASFHTGMSNSINAAVLEKDATATAEDTEVAFILQQIWFANLVGWMGGMHDKDAVVDRMRFAAKRLL